MKQQIKEYLNTVEFNSEYWDFIEIKESNDTFIIRFKHVNKDVYRTVDISVDGNTFQIIVSTYEEIRVDLSIGRLWSNIETFKEVFTIFKKYIENKDILTLENL